MDNCKILFSILDSSYFNSDDLLFLLVAIIVYILLFTVHKSLMERIFQSFVFLIVAFLTITNLVKYYSNISNLKSIYSNKNYKEVVGKISDFSMKKNKRGDVYTFKVNNVEFKLTNEKSAENIGDNNNIKADDMFLDSNNTVTIRYTDKLTSDTKNLILYLEVCKK